MLQVEEKTGNGHTPYLLELLFANLSTACVVAVTTDLASTYFFPHAVRAGRKQLTSGGVLTSQYA